MKTAELSAAKKLSLYGTTVPRYLRTSSGCSRTASEKEQKMMPTSASFSLNVVATETESNTASTATPARRSCSERDAELLERLAQLGIDLVDALELRLNRFPSSNPMAMRAPLPADRNEPSTKGTGSSTAKMIATVRAIRDQNAKMNGRESSAFAR